MYLRLQCIPGPDNPGIATFGAGDIGSVPIAGFTETFMEKMLVGQRVEVDWMPGMIPVYG